ncbi:Tetratricopeptide repeat protein [Marinomonas spartinae]|uniref:vWA domain-containing protein n=1 Tax=Marinomonas spartinae TaxID=1792290 RepID=UPI000808E524|nr:VWA domain-containing protein [Marinomonas spartinae]SBS36707.1 Tetratricopeptide repeat protein [Marinomonas spartinae]
MNILSMIHFARPYWLLLLPLIWLLFFLIRYKNTGSNTLSKAFDQNLLVHLEQSEQPSHINKWLGLLSISLCVIGLSGISWVKAPSMMFESSSKTIFVIDQSLSMYAKDIQPNRQTLLIQTVRDILGQSKDGNIALVAFAGDAYTITPFSQDKNTITHFLLALEPIIMPVYGSNLTSGVKDALSLIPNKKTSAHLIILTDSLNAKDKKAIPSLLADHHLHTDLIAIGTKKGGTILLPNGQILTSDGKNVVPHTPVEQLKTFAKTIHAHFYHGRLTSAQLNAITQNTDQHAKDQQADNRSFHWIDQGHWFAFPFLLWLAFQFRRGMLLTLMLSVFLLPSNKASASPLDWFKTPDQLGQEAANHDHWKKANQYFQQPDWKAASEYALGKYSQAANTLSGISKSAADFYNLGNALALSGKLQPAIDAYKRALALDPTMKEAQDNLRYLEKQKKQQQSKNANKKKQSNKKSSSNKNSSSHKNKSSDKNHSNSKQNHSPKQTPPSHSSDKASHDSTAKKQNKSPEKQDKKPSSEDNKQTPEEKQQQSKSATNTDLNREQKQALKQWLRQIQDNPGTLLQRKLWYLHQEKSHENYTNQEDGINPW